MKVCQYISSLAEGDGLSQSDVSREIGISRQSLSYILSGEREMTLSQALRLESLFSLDRGTLVRMQDDEKISRHIATLRDSLCEKLIRANAFWSYAVTDARSVQDEDIVEKTLKVLDIDDISVLFEIFPRKFIRKVWDERLACQGEYMENLNMMIAQYCFGIKEPEKYLKRKELGHIRRMTNNAQGTY